MSDWTIPDVDRGLDRSRPCSAARSRWAIFGCFRKAHISTFGKEPPARRGHPFKKPADLYKHVHIRIKPRRIRKIKTLSREDFTRIFDGRSAFESRNPGLWRVDGGKFRRNGAFSEFFARADARTPSRLRRALVEAKLFWNSWRRQPRWLVRHAQVV